MQKPFRNGTMKYLFPALLASLFTLQGCAPAVVTPEAPPVESIQGDATIQQANTLLSQGKKREAAAVYYRVAATYPSPQRERVILQAAEIAASIDDAGLTESYLARVPSTSLDGENKGRYAYVKALLALQAKKPNLALSVLPADLNGLSPALREKIQHIQQRATAMGGKYGNRSSGQNIQHAIVPISSNQIAVLLPESGSLGSVSQDIYKGIQAAQASTANDSHLKVYDVNNGGAVAQYQKAVAEGADMIIGPLDKESLAELLAQPKILTKPILSLNYLTGTQNVPGALYQFGLLPEDEAHQVADFALSRGQRTAIILAPNSSWGERLAGAFRTAYQSKGGQVIHVEQYPDAPSGYLQNVQNALAASQGKASMVFLAASPSQARLMRPLLAAQANNLPVYATSHIFSGHTDPSKDTDLNGIIYTEIPWVLESMQNGSLNNGGFPRMYALGMDAFLIAKNLPNLVQNPGATLTGKTGNIRLPGNRQVQRSLAFATFANGLPRPLGQ